MGYRETSIQHDRLRYLKPESRLYLNFNSWGLCALQFLHCFTIDCCFFSFSVHTHCMESYPFRCSKLSVLISCVT